MVCLSFSVGSYLNVCGVGEPKRHATEVRSVDVFDDSAELDRAVRADEDVRAFVFQEPTHDGLGPWPALASVFVLRYVSHHLDERSALGGSQASHSSTSFASSSSMT